MKQWLFALGALCALIVQPQLAQASVTAATLAVNGPNPYVGQCPDAVQFKGTIAGTPGTVFTYSFNRFVDSVQQVIPGATLTMPSGGSIAVNDSITIASATSGSTFDQIWVHNISGGQTDVYSNEAAFTVSCGVAIPKGLVLVLQPPAPTAVGDTTDPPTCTNHAGIGGGIACMAGIPKGQLALVWQWSPVKGVPNVDGFKVYRVDGGQHTFVTQQSAKLDNGAIATLAMLFVPPDGFNGKCYAVTAYLGKGESHDSNYFCAGGYQGGPIVESFNLTLGAIDPVWHNYHFSGGGPGCGLSMQGTGPIAGDNVGYVHTYDSSAGFTCLEDTLVAQTAVRFDLGTAGIILRNPKASVQSATLTFQRTDGTNTSCLAGLRLPTVDWTGATDLIRGNADFYRNIPTGANISVNAAGAIISGPNYSFAVSKPINDWAKGVSPNYGFILTGPNEDTSDFHDNNRCFSTYGGFALSVQVVIAP